MKERIMGVDISTYNYEQLGERILSDIENKYKANIVAINPEKILMANEDENLRILLNEATYQIPDGAGVVWASKLKNGSVKERVTGIDMFLFLCELASKHNKKIFLYGAKPGVAKKASEKLVTKFPGLTVAGTLDGYEQDQNKVKDIINQSQADMIFVALGSPRQELWIRENMNNLYPSIYQGVGGSFDVVSGNLKRAPQLYQKVGLEWFYRLMKEPWRFKRILRVFVFGFKALKTK